MIDGTGMCGGCRVSLGNETKFACVDGPEFDGHKVNFDELQDRLGDLPRIRAKGRSPAPPENCRLRKTTCRPKLDMSARITTKERMQITRQSMPEQDAAARAANFLEVNLGFHRTAGACWRPTAVCNAKIRAASRAARWA